MGPDGWIDQFISNHPPGEILRTSALLLNKLGKGDTLAFLCIVLILAGYLIGRSRWIKIGAGGILALIVESPFLHGIKHLVGRSRPQMRMGDLHFIGPDLVKNGFDSFPSGHATASFAVASFISAFFPQGRWIFYGIAAVISLIGRVAMRYHFLSDVIGGAALGIAVGLFCARRLKNWVESPSSAVPSTPSSAVTQNEPGKLPSILLIAAVSAIMLLVGLGNSALWDRDETEYAQSIIEMNQKHHWLIPTLEGEPFVEKPILMYWIAKASHQIFGTTEFGFRLPSALFGILTCIATFFLGRVLWNNRAGLLSGLILSTSFLFAGGFRLLMTDPFLVFFSVCALLFYVHSWKNPSRRAFWLTLSYLAIGLSVLTKGPFGFFPIPVFLIFEFWNESKTFFEFCKRNILRHVLFSLISVAIAAPWFIYSFSVQKQETRKFFLYDNFLRFLQGTEGHTGPMFYYIPVLLAGFLPWAFFVFPSVKQEWRRRIDGRLQPETFLLSTWIIFLFIFFSICSNKLPHYMLPVLPALACIIGKYWDNQIFGEAEPVRWPIAVTIRVMFLLAAATVTLYIYRPQYASLKLTFPFLIAFVLLWLALSLSKKEEWGKSFAAIVLSSVLLFVAVSVWSLPWIDQQRVMKPMGLAIKKYVPSDAVLAGYYVSEPSLFIYGQRLFPKIENQPLDSLLSGSQTSYVVTSESVLRNSNVKLPYHVLDRETGFAENGGETTLLLISNRKPS